MINKIFLAIALCISSFHSGFSQQPTQGLLWEITGNGLSSPSYLYGTMHVSNKVAFHLSDSFYLAINAVDMVALEINPETWMEKMTSDDYVARRMGNPFIIRSDYSNTGFYKSIFQCEAPDNKDLGGTLAQDFMILNSLLYRTDGYNEDFQEETYLDLFIYQAGKKLGKEIAGLEDLATTMKLNERAARQNFDADALKKLREEAERRRNILLKIIKDQSLPEAIENAYRSGDLDLLDTLSKLSNVNDLYHELMIVERNKGMARMMDSIMQQKSLFAGVGAAHLPNKYGVLQLLRDMGYTVRAVKKVQTEKGDDFKQDIEETFIAHNFEKRWSEDYSFSTFLPGPLYQFPESNNSMIAVFPDMANGATYTITRKYTFGELYGVSPLQYRKKLDSLLYENIPGKIHEQKNIEVSGYPAIDILNETKTGDYQRYRIVFTPLEIIVFKVAGMDEFALREDVAQFFDKIEIHKKYPKRTFTQFNNAYSVQVKGRACYEPSSSAFSKRYWKRDFQAYDAATETYYAVFNRSYGDFNYMEEDSFELGAMGRFFVQQFGYEIVNSNPDSFMHYSSYVIKGQKEGKPNLYVRLIYKGEQYYLICCQTNSEERFIDFSKSFQFHSYTYSQNFKDQKDTNLYYSVHSPVEPELASNNAYSYYYLNQDEPEDYEQVSKTSHFNCIETDESISVFYLKFNRYFGAPHADSIFNVRIRKLTNDGEFLVLNKKSWSDSAFEYREMEISDTNSNRLVIGRFVLCKDRIYSIYAESDKFMPRSKFITEFLKTFRPWDTLVSTEILGSKVPLLVSDLKSADTVSRNAAMNSIALIEFSNSDVDELMQALEESYPARIAVEVKAKLFGALYGLKHPDLISFLSEKYRMAGDTLSYQVPILKVLASQHTAEAMEVFGELIHYRTPIAEESILSQFMAYPFYDTIQLIAPLFPKLLDLTRIPEYKALVYGHLANLASNGKIKPKKYKKYLKEIIQDAHNDITRLNAGNSIVYSSSNSYSRTRRGATSGKNNGYTAFYALDSYLKILTPFSEKRKDVKALFSRIRSMNNPWVNYNISVIRLMYDMPVADSVWHNLARKEKFRFSLYTSLYLLDRLDLFPAQYLVRDSLIKAHLFSMGSVTSEDSIVLLRKDWVVNGSDSGYVYLYKIMDRETEVWKMVMLGMYADSNSVEITQSVVNNYIKYNKYQDENLQVDLLFRRLEMKHRERYRVEDEKKFKDLRGSSSYYGY